MQCGFIPQFESLWLAYFSISARPKRATGVHTNRNFRIADHPLGTGQIRFNESAEGDIGGQYVVSSHTKFRLVVLVFSGIRDRERAGVTRRKPPAFGRCSNRYPVHFSNSLAGPLA